MKRIALTLALSLGFCLSLAGCGGGPTSSVPPDPEKSKLRPVSDEKQLPPELDANSGVRPQKVEGGTPPPKDD